MDKNKKIIVGILIMLLIIGVGLVIAYKLVENSDTNRANFNFTVQNMSSNPVATVNNEKHEQNYSKVIDDVKLELNIPNEWKYEEMPKNEENDFYKYALKLYKSDESQYAILYFYNNPFGVCGTGRTAENIVLNNGKEAVIGYYDGKKDWSDISFYTMNKNIAVMNYGLADTNAKEIIEFIKTINVTEDNLKEEEIKNAILEYLVKKGDNEYKHHENEKTFVSIKIYLTKEKENQQLYDTYAWVLEEKYYFENNEIKQDSGSSIPYKFVIESIDGKFTVKDATIPRDGSYYAEDMKSIFPSSVSNDMDKIQEDGTMEKLELDIRKQTELYFQNSKV